VDAANASDRDTDCRILETIIRAIEEGTAGPALVAHRREFTRLQALCKTPEYDGDLWTFLAEHARAGYEARITTVEKVLEFVRGQAEKYRAIKATRALTEDEKRYGNDVLLPLLENLRSLLGKGPGEDASDTKG
jgi:hypothetical protein